MKKYQGKLNLNGKVYKCEVIDGIRYIAGQTVEKFMETLDEKDLLLFSDKGKRILGLKKEVIS